MTGREAALEVRMAAERGRRLDRAFAAVAEGLERRERSLAHELAYGTTRLRGRLDHRLSRLVDRGLEGLDPTVLEVLRLGAYQLLHLDGVPAYAAVSASVDLVRQRVGERPSGLVNAVLRRLAGEADGVDSYPSFADDPATFLTTWGSHPRWLVERWMRRWPVPVVRAMVEADNRRPAVTLVPLDVDPAEAVRRLERAGLAAAPVGAGTGCVRLGDDVHPSDALAVLPHAVVQDPAAHLVARYADVPRGTNVADLCAAPGGKVVAVADRPAYTLASDRSESRIRMVRQNALRTGRRVGLAVADATRPPVASVDVVLLDVPCTGTGTLARHPDARWRLRPESVEEMAAVQERLLEAAADVVTPGGLLVYSTCSLEPEENEHRVRAFLDGRPDFRIDATDAVPGNYRAGDGTLFVTPAEHGFDGAFAARLRRAA